MNSTNCHPPGIFKIPPLPYGQTHVSALQIIFLTTIQPSQMCTSGVFRKWDADDDHQFHIPITTLSQATLHSIKNSKFIIQNYQLPISLSHRVRIDTSTLSMYSKNRPPESYPIYHK